MPQLPNAGNAVLDDAKVIKYLLDNAHPQNNGKDQFFYGVRIYFNELAGVEECPA